MLSALALAFGLAMDATAVSTARAFGAKAHRELAILPLAVRRISGGHGGARLARSAASRGPYFAAWDHWVAFVLLVADRRQDARRSVARRRRCRAQARAPPLLYVVLAFATSIDAAAAGHHPAAGPGRAGRVTRADRHDHRGALRAWLPRRPFARPQDWSEARHRRRARPHRHGSEDFDPSIPC